MLSFALASKVEAAASNLSSQDEWYKYCDTSSVEEVINLISQKPIFQNLKRTATVNELELSIKNIQYVELERFLPFVNYPAKTFLNTIMLRREMESIKEMIRYKHAGLTEKPVLTTSSNLNLQKIYDDSSSVVDIISALKDTIYFINLQSAIPNYENTKSCYFFETALDYTYWNFFRERMSVLYGDDKKVASYYVGVEEDLHNLAWIYRSKFLYTLAPEEITSYILPNGYNISKEKLQDFVNIENKKDFINLAAEHGYSELFKTEEISSFLFLLSSIRERRTKSNDLKKSGLGYLLWYLVQMQTEMNMLTMILESIDMNIDLEKRKSVIKEVL